MSKVYKKNENPFSLNFGSLPPMYIEPKEVVDEIMGKLSSKYRTDNCFILTGVRGSGKTVTMTDIVHRVRQMDDYIVVRIPLTEDILCQVISQLYSTNEFIRDFIKLNLNLSLFGIGISVDSIEPSSDIFSAAVKIMETIQKKNKKLLIAIDEVSKSKDVERFGKEFNTLSSEGYPIYLIMTGLPENVTSLLDAKDLTFLRRACKKEMQPLNATLVRRVYMDTFDIGMEEAHILATLTNGYPTAFELLGQILWDKGSPVVDDDVLKRYDDELESKVYSSIWKSLSECEKMYLCCIAQKEEMTVSEILELAKKKSNEFSQYREKLIRKGLIESVEYGKIRQKLPRFDSFVKTMIILENRSI